MGDRQIWYHIREGFRSIFTHGLHVHCGGVHDRGLPADYGVLLPDRHQRRTMCWAIWRTTTSSWRTLTTPSPEAQAQALESQIKAVPNVADIHFVTKEEALANFKANQERQRPV